MFHSRINTDAWEDQSGIAFSVQRGAVYDSSCILAIAVNGYSNLYPYFPAIFPMSIRSRFPLLKQVNGIDVQYQA